VKVRLPQKVKHYLGVFSMEKKRSEYDYAFKLECVKLVLEKCAHLLKGIEIKPSQMDWVL
jgi:hypothetical protein